MTITVEDGTGSNPDANSYASVQDLRDFAAAIGYADLPADDLECEPLLLNAMFVIEGKCWKGERTYPDIPQPLSFPRTGLSHDGVDYASDEIPAWLVQSQCSLATTQNDTALFTNAAAGSTQGAVIEETVVGAVSVKYADGGESSLVTKDSRAESLMSPFYCYGSGGGFGIGIRI